MKEILVIVLAGMMICSNAFAISLADGYKSSGVLGPNAHSHITTSPSRVYSITVTPYAADGYAQLLATKGPRADGAFSAVNSHVIVMAGGHTANDTRQIIYPAGVKVGDNLFLNCMNANASVAYQDD